MLARALSAYRRLPLAPEIRARLRYRILRAIPWAFPRLTHPGLDPAEATPARQDHARQDYLVFGVIDWHLRFQRPQHLAVRLAHAGHRVFYVSSNLIPHPAAGFRVEPLDASGRLFQVHLQGVGVPGIYYGLGDGATVRQLGAGLRALGDWAGARNPVALLEHPFWLSAAQTMALGTLVYDRMDYHAGFADWSATLAAEEERLIRAADLTVVTSNWLDARTAPLTPSCALIRNGADWGHFATRPPAVFADPGYPRVIGYYGAIAHWVDLDLIEAIARRFPDCLVLLLGHDQAGAARRLGKLGNVRLPGEVPYPDLPYYLYGFAVCLLPFRRIDLTLATNPVKVYEYLSAGLPVVASDLPEMGQFGDLVYIGSGPEGWLDAIEAALSEPAEDPIRLRRKQFAAAQTWDTRAQALMGAIEALRSGTADGTSPTP
jgi:glycosyltransferase involved in cell wall biosynthesis